MGRLVLGLDIGITSVGYGVIDIDEKKAIDYGVRLFDEGLAEGNEARRAKRGSRRLKSRRKTRLFDAKKLMINEGLISKDYKFSLNPYEARVKGITQKVSNEELATALYHLIKMRGSSLETIEDEDKITGDDKSAKEALAINDKELKEGKYICEIQMKRFNNDHKLRGHINNFRTSDYVKEAEKILSNQSVSEDFKKQIITLIKRKRSFAEGPGSAISPTPYGRFTEYGQLEPINLIDKMRGHCSVYPSELRAAKMSYKADLFNFLNDLNNLTIKGEKIEIEQKEEAIKIINEKGSITPKQLAKLLDISIDDISGFRIDKNGNSLLTEFKGYKLIKKVLNDSKTYEDHELVDKIIDILTKTKIYDERVKSIKGLSDALSDNEIDELAKISKISGYHSLSTKALNELNTELLNTTNNQMQILSLKNHSSEKLNKYKDKKKVFADDTAILSPVAKRAQREACKVVNRLREIHGEFDSIVIETTRAKNSSDQKAQIKESQKFFDNANKRAQTLLDECDAKVKLNGKLRLKLRLYEEQQAKTAYTMQPIDLSLLINDPEAYEVDHIIPVSVSLDDSYSNKVLVTRMENQQKGNLTPLAAYAKGKFKDSNVEEYLANVSYLRGANGSRFDKKKGYLLKDADLTKFDNMKEFINRNLVDTSYANRVVLNTLQDYFKANGINTNVFTIKGSATHMFRTRIKLDKVRDSEDIGFAHHAIDALIIASIKTFPNLNRILGKYKSLDAIYDEETGEVYDVIDDDKYFDAKYLELIHHLFMLEKDVVKFSYKIDTKPNRKVADDTIYSTRITDEGEKVVKKYKDIYDPKQLNIANDILNENYEKYLMYKVSPNDFKQIVDIVKYYEKTQKENEKVFNKTKGEFKINPLSLYLDDNKEPIHKLAKKGDGPAIKQMKYYDGKLGNAIDITANYETNNKHVILQQISPYRTDFYYSKTEGYKFVTVRYSNVYYSKEKNKFEINEKWYEEQKEIKKIDKSYSFCFSMHRGELIKILKESDNVNDVSIMKFTATNNDSKNIVEVKPLSYHEKKQIMLAISKKVKVIEKYASDVCGNLYKVSNQQLKLEFE